MIPIPNKGDFENRIANVAKDNKLTKEQVRAVIRGMHPSTSTYVLSKLALIPLGKLISHTPAELPV